MEVDGYEARLAAQRDYRNGARRAWQNIQADAADVAGATDDMLTTGFNTASNALADFATTGKMKFRDFASSVINDMARIASQQAATGLLSGLIGGRVGSRRLLRRRVSHGRASQSGYTGNAYANPLPRPTAAPGRMACSSSPMARLRKPIVSRPTARHGRRPDGDHGRGGAGGNPAPARGADGSLGVRAVGGGGGTALQVNAPVAVTSRTAALRATGPAGAQQNMQLQMKAAAERAVADSWRPGGVSYRNMAGRG